MKDILETIVAHKRIEVNAAKHAQPLQSLLSEHAAAMERPPLSMRAALAKSASGVIAEFKRKSPSKGWLHRDAQVADVVPFYEQGGASASSILTDSEFFGGSLKDLQQARAMVQLPLLRKDFIIDEYQLFQARAAGADTVLLIAAALTQDECRRLSQTAHSLGLEILLEIHSADELSYLNQHIDLLGVNNRNLGTFHTTVENSFRLAEQLRLQVGISENAPLLISESGIADVESVRNLRQSGFCGFLIGETFMKTANPGDTLKKFIEGILSE